MAKQMTVGKKLVLGFGVVLLLTVVIGVVAFVGVDKLKNSRDVLSKRDVLCLHIESDMMDKRVISEAQMKNRIDAFFEGLDSRKIRLGETAKV